MKVYILIDENNIVRDMSSLECNLDPSRVETMTMCRVEKAGRPGDEYDQSTNEWIKRPENYPKPNQDFINEKKIKEEMNKITREQAIQNLKDKGELDVNYSEQKNET